MKKYELQMNGWCQKTINVDAKNEEDALTKLYALHEEQQEEDFARNIPESFIWDTRDPTVEKCARTGLYEMYLKGHCTKTLQVIASDLDAAYHDLMELHQTRDIEHCTDGTHGFCHHWDDVWDEEIYEI